MSEHNEMDQTKPMKNAIPEDPSGKKRQRYSLIASLMVVGGAFLLLGSLMGWLGFRQGEEQHNSYLTVTVDAYLAAQFEMAVDDFTAGNYTLARERLEYVLAQKPDYKPAMDLLVDVSVIMSSTATPTLVPPTATPTATPDLRPAEDQLNTVIQLISLKEWDMALDSLANLRKTQPDYKIVEVDGYIYLALRNRGIDKILNRGDLEGGIYDFTLAENFGPLDGEAENYRTWARLYLLGNAFWGANPEQAAYYYGQLVSAAPSLTDASGVSAFYRYWASLLQQAEFLARDENWCEASEKMVHVLGTWDQAYVYPTATWVSFQCEKSKFTPTPTITLTPTATATLGLPPGSGSSTPTSTVPAEQTPTATIPGQPPTATSTPTPTPTETVPGPPTDTSTPTPTKTPEG